MFRFGKPAPRQSSPSSPDTSEQSEDLLAQGETEDFEASVLAAQARARARQGKPGPSEEPMAVRLSEEREAGEVIWEEQSDVYRPAPVDVRSMLEALSLRPTPRLRQGESLVVIRQAAFAAIEQHLRSDLHVELGGLLGGQAFYDRERALYLTVVEMALPALEGTGTPTSFAYTPASWQAILPKWQQMHRDWTIVGSYHSHPGLGVFLSATDRATQAEIFAQDWQIALVMDPVADRVGFFIGVEGRPCPAWFV